jgi:hypothetical protein
MMKSKMILIMASVLLVIVFAISGCGTKATGGGFIRTAAPCSEEKATFGFNAQLLEDVEEGEPNAKGQFQLVDHGTGEKFHGVITGMVVGLDNNYTVGFYGETKDGTPLQVIVTDLDQDGVVKDGDLIEIWIGDYHNEGQLQGGNINVK